MATSLVDDRRFSNGVQIITRKDSIDAPIHHIKVVCGRHADIATQLYDQGTQLGLHMAAIDQQSAVTFRTTDAIDANTILSKILNHLATMPNIFPADEIAEFIEYFNVENSLSPNDAFKKFNRGQVATLRATGSFKNDIYDRLLDANTPDEVRAILYDAERGEKGAPLCPEITKQPEFITYTTALKTFEKEQQEAAEASPQNFKTLNALALRRLRGELEKEFKGNIAENRAFVAKELFACTSFEQVLAALHRLQNISAPSGGGNASVCRNLWFPIHQSI